MRSLSLFTLVSAVGLAVALPSASQAATPAAAPAASTSTEAPAEASDPSTSDPSKQACGKDFKSCIDKAKSNDTFKTCNDGFAKCFDAKHASDKDDDLKNTCKAMNKWRGKVREHFCAKQKKGGHKCSLGEAESAKTICSKFAKSQKDDK